MPLIFFPCSVRWHLYTRTHTHMQTQREKHNLNVSRFPQIWCTFGVASTVVYSSSEGTLRHERRNVRSFQTRVKNTQILTVHRHQPICNSLYLIHSRISLFHLMKAAPPPKSSTYYGCSVHLAVSFCNHWYLLLFLCFSFLYCLLRWT